VSDDDEQEKGPGDRDGDRGKEQEGPGDPMSDRAERDLSSTQIFGAIEDVPEADPESTGDLGARLAEQLPPGSALLVVRRGPNAGSRFLLDTDVTTAGRHPESDIFLDDVTVSRRHAEFRREQGTFSVRDVGSLNGTYVNRERVEQATLANSDEVQIGKFRLIFLLGPASGTTEGVGR
jgi:pSer/pThr/pTyr-binding forkhead associated (FHA) protein